jgi:hypothetical protein
VRLRLFGLLVALLLPVAAQAQKEEAEFEVEAHAEEGQVNFSAMLYTSASPVFVWLQGQPQEKRWEAVAGLNLRLAKGVEIGGGIGLEQTDVIRELGEQLRAAARFQLERGRFESEGMFTFGRSKPWIKVEGSYEIEEGVRFGGSVDGGAGPLLVADLSSVEVALIPYLYDFRRGEYAGAKMAVNIKL